MTKIIRLTESELNGIIEESVRMCLDEGWKDWAMAGALGAASMFSSPASAQNTIQQQNSDSIKTELTNRLLKPIQGNVSNDSVNMFRQGYSSPLVMMKNAKENGNGPIRQFLSSNIGNLNSTQNIKVFRYKDYNKMSSLLSTFTKEQAKQYKLFNFNSRQDEIYVLMPIGFTLEDVQKELGYNDVFTLDDFDM